MGMIEKVALALWEHDRDYNAKLGHSIVPFEESDYLDSARAAIIAMRDPMEHVEDAARGLWLWYASLPGKAGWTLGKHNKAAGYKLSLTDEEAALEHAPKHVCGRIAWRTMIDACLNSTPK